jgi:hypothetical protein
MPAAYQQQYAARPMPAQENPFPYNNMPPQPIMNAYVQQAQPNNHLPSAAAPDFFSKSRPVDSHDFNDMTNPFM